MWMLLSPPPTTRLLSYDAEKESSVQTLNTSQTRQVIISSVCHQFMIDLDECVHTHSGVDDHGIDLRDLQTGSEDRKKQHTAQSCRLQNGRANGKQTTRSWASLVVWSFCPDRFDILQEQRDRFRQMLHKKPLSGRFWIWDDMTVTFLMSSFQLHALISPFPVLRRWQSLESRENTGPSWADKRTTDHVFYSVNYRQSSCAGIRERLHSPVNVRTGFWLSEVASGLRAADRLW